MTIPRMIAINKAQKVRPPAYIALDNLRHLVAGYMGVKLDSNDEQAQNPSSDGRGSDGTTLFDLFPS